MAQFYPVFLDLRDRPCVVIGGGGVAELKVIGLLDAGARVTVISPAATGRLEDLASRGAIQVARRPYRPGDLTGAFLAVAATDDRPVTHAVWQEAEARGVLINAVDDLPHCTFIAPAVHRQGDLTIAVSTAGGSPALAVRLRDRIGRLVGPEYNAFLALLGSFRAEVMARIPDAKARTALWYRIVDSEAIGLIRAGDIAGARAHVAGLVSEAARDGAMGFAGGASLSGPAEAGG
jgi:siroheme synthase-like protein